VNRRKKPETNPFCETSETVTSKRSLYFGSSETNLPDFRQNIDVLNSVPNGAKGRF
jgi:hypothetical protein